MVQALVCTQDWLRGRNLKPKVMAAKVLKDGNIEDEILVEGNHIIIVMYQVLTSLL